MTSATGMTFGYARVSTTEQDEALQRDVLAAAGVDKMFVDKLSGSLQHRPALEGLSGKLRAGDTVVVWRLDRLGRSLRHLVELVGELDQRGVGLRGLTEQIDTTTPNGKLIFHLFAALAEFQRDLIRERTRAGLAAARDRGRIGGRPSVLTPQKLKTAEAMYASDEHDVATIAKVLGVSRASVYRGLAEQPGSYGGTE